MSGNEVSQSTSSAAQPTSESRQPWEAEDLELEGNEPISVPSPLVADLVKATSHAYGLRYDELGIFDQGWVLHHRIAQFDGQLVKLEALRLAASAEVDRAAERLKKAILGEPIPLRGHDHVRRIPLSGKYVIFSDHHFVYTGHRTNFFGERGNLQTYAQALRRYDDAGFAVIENGDVEDLVFFDPAFLPHEAKRRMNLSFEDLQARRGEVRKQQLQQILSDPGNAELVVAAKKLDAKGRLIRVAGNHDYDEQRPEFLEVLHHYYPNLETPADYLLLEDSDRVVKYAVLHGHQWDPVTEPTVAPRLGETISETLGLYTQGPDRTWLWNADGVKKWALGAKPFLNNLVAEPPSLIQLIVEFVERLLRRSRVDTADPLSALAHAKQDGTLEDIIDFLAGKNIGWDYFIHNQPFEAVLTEVLTGDRFFKFRLLDEEFIRKQLIKTFGSNDPPQPVLILGHSHEVRFNAWSSHAQEVFPGYLNTAAAGRWENLMWAIEIVDGEATLVSWSRESLPQGPIQRRKWRSFVQDGVGLVQADQDPSQVP